eukprot:scaffold81404_cov65-Phaeocystis_antarctica.AAC.1
MPGAVGERKRQSSTLSALRWTASTLPVGNAMDRGRGNADGLCVMFDGSSQCTIVLPEKCLGYGLVVPFLAYRFALWFRIMKT